MSDISADDAELAAQSNQFQGWYEGYHGRDDEVAELKSKIERLTDALQKIADADYRGNRSTESSIAFQALQRM